MKTWKPVAAVVVLSGLMGAAGVLVGFTQASLGGYQVDGRVESMTPAQLQRAVSLLGIDARSFTYHSVKPHVLRVEAEDYVDGKVQTTEVLGRQEVPGAGKQSFMVFVDTRQAEHLGFSEAFLGPVGGSTTGHAWVKRPKNGYAQGWSDKAELKVGERAPLFYLVEERGKAFTSPAPVEKMVAQFPRVLVVYALLESESEK